jgi:hypothetical protein
LARSWYEYSASGIPRTCEELEKETESAMNPNFFEYVLSTLLEILESFFNETWIERLKATVAHTEYVYVEESSAASVQGVEESGAVKVTVPLVLTTAFFVADKPDEY